MRIVRLSLVAAILVVTGTVLVRLHTAGPLSRPPDTVVSEALPRLAFLRDSLEHGSAEEMQQIFPEGYLFSHLLYGLSWVQVGLRSPAVRPRAVAEARWALSHVDSPAGRAPFDASLDPPYGVFYVGWSTWLRGGIVALSGSADPRFDSDGLALAAAFERSPEPFLPAYPGQAWPCDSVVALAAIALGDTLNGTSHDSLFARWLSLANSRRDPSTGLLPHTATPGSGARATSQVIILRFLHEFAPAVGAADWVAFTRQFGSDIPGVPGIREYPRGVDGSGDVDSGPLPFGLSFSASAVALGDAVLYGDSRTASALTGLAEATGLPFSWGGRKRYAFGLLPIGDAFLLWSFTAVSPRAPYAVPRMAYAEEEPWPSRFWRVPWYAMGLLALLFAALVMRLGRAWRHVNAGGMPGSGPSTVPAEVEIL